MGEVFSNWDEINNSNKCRQVVAMIGSTRFMSTFIEKCWEFSKLGFVVTLPNFRPENMMSEEFDISDTILEDIGFKRIDMADKVFVVNQDGYIGSSTRKEIIRAYCLGKLIRYMEPISDELEWEFIKDAIKESNNIKEEKNNMEEFSQIVNEEVVETDEGAKEVLIPENPEPADDVNLGEEPVSMNAADDQVPVAPPTELLYFKPGDVVIVLDEFEYTMHRTDNYIGDHKPILLTAHKDDIFLINLVTIYSDKDFVFELVRLNKTEKEGELVICKEDRDEIDNLVACAVVFAPDRYESLKNKFMKISFVENFVTLGIKNTRDRYNG